MDNKEFKILKYCLTGVVLSATMIGYHIGKKINNDANRLSIYKAASVKSSSNDGKPYASIYICKNNNGKKTLVYGFEHKLTKIPFSSITYICSDDSSLQGSLNEKQVIIEYKKGVFRKILEFVGDNESMDYLINEVESNT